MQADFIKCSISNTELRIKGRATRWKFIVPISYEKGKTGDKHGICIQKNPLDTLARDCEDDSAKAIMSHLYSLSKRWLDYDSSDPVQVHPSFKGHDAKVLPDHNELNHPGDYLAVK